MDDVQQIRRFLPKIYLVCAVTIGLCYLTSFGDFFNQLSDLKTGAPAVRISTFSVLTFFLAAFVVLLSITLTLKAVRFRDGVVQKLVSALNVMTFTSFGLMMVLTFTSTPLQNHYMHKSGYSQCDLLQGNPTMWFTDWVKNPEWCVRGKSREWVKEQAALVQQKS